MSNNNKNGFILIWVVGIVSIASVFLMICMESLMGCMSYRGLMDSLDIDDEVRKTSRIVLFDDYSYAFTNFMEFDQNRLKRRLAWAFPKNAELLDITRSAYSSEPFSEEVESIKCHNNIHPLGSRVGNSIQQNIFIKYLNRYTNKVKNIKLVAHLKEIPSSEVSFITPSVFSPDNLSIPMVVKGGTTLCHGFRNGSGSRKFHCDKLITKFYETDTLNKPYGHLYSGYQYAFGYGIDPFKLLLFGGDPSEHNKQAYFKKPGLFFALFDGERISPQLPGVTVRSFNENIKRVVIDLSLIDRAKGGIYIHASNENAVKQGIVIKGTSKNAKNQPSAILTNSNIWLWGNHTASPMVLGTTTGHWTLTDASWAEGKAPSKPLKLNWRGYLFSPFNLTAFSSPQSGDKTGTFEIEGTLLAGGSISGNLKELLISKHPVSNKSISEICEKFLILENIE